MSIGHKGMMQAAKILALTVVASALLAALNKASGGISRGPYLSRSFDLMITRVLLTFLGDHLSLTLAVGVGVFTTLLRGTTLTLAAPTTPKNSRRVTDALFFMCASTIICH